MLKPYFETDNGKLYHGDCLSILKQLPDESIDCVMTSPPYWALRDYGIEPRIWDRNKDCEHEFDIEIIKEQTKISNKTGLHNDGRKNPITEKYRATLDSMTLNEYKRGFCLKCGAWKGSLGLEPTLQLYIQHLIQIFSEVKRVLKDDGTLWLNMGDSYATNSPPGSRDPERWPKQSKNDHQPGRAKKNDNLKPKDLIGMPWRVAFALQADGWYLRSDIIWHKPNPMPESVTDRPTKSHEYIFLMSKSAKYYYDAEAIKEKVSGNSHDRGNGINPKSKYKTPDGWDSKKGAHGSYHSEGREKGKTGYTHKPRLKQNESFSRSINELVENRNKRTVWTIPTQGFSEAHFATFPVNLIYPCIKAGCRLEGIVLDPFIGSGTTAIVAERLDRKWCGIEINAEYLNMAINRIKKETAQYRFA